MIERGDNAHEKELPQATEDVRLKRIRLWVSYDGTNYHGWQLQNNGITIESELNRALTELYGREIRVVGASRTDAGVHALGNVAVFDVASPIPAEKVCYALNARLPEDIRITESEEVPPDWHPRKCESRKTYEYRIYLGRVLPPVKRLYCHHVYRTLDLGAMREAAVCLIGEHDFKSFCQENAQVESTVRRVYSLELTFTPAFAGHPAASENALAPKAKEDGSAILTPDNEGELVIRVTGGGFLYNMVRIIVGTLLEVGCGRLTPEAVRQILEAKDRSAAGPTAPARGLTLVRYEFRE